MSEVTAVPIRPIARGSLVKLWIALALLLAAGAALAWVGTGSLQRTITETGLQYQVLKAGAGPNVTPADVVALHYEGRLPNGEMFDSSASRGQPMVTTVNGILPGFAEGLQLMQAGGRYKLWIPPNLGYGPGRIPPGAPFTADDTLVFNIQVLEIVPGAAGMYEMQRMQQMQQQMQGATPPGTAPGAAPGGAPAPPAGDPSGRGRGPGR